MGKLLVHMMQVFLPPPPFCLSHFVPVHCRETARKKSVPGANHADLIRSYNSKSAILEKMGRLPEALQVRGIAISLEQEMKRGLSNAKDTSKGWSFETIKADELSRNLFFSDNILNLI